MTSERFVLKPDPGSYHDYRSILVDSLTGEEIGFDCGEPEDNSFGRDWSWVPDKLNELAAQLAERDTQIEQLTAGLKTTASPDMDNIAKGLGADRQGCVEATGGYFGAVQLAADSARLRAENEEFKSSREHIIAMLQNVGGWTGDFATDLARAIYANRDLRERLTKSPTPHAAIDDLKPYIHLWRKNCQCNCHDCTDLSQALKRFMDTIANPKKP